MGRPGPHPTPSQEPCTCRETQAREGLSSAGWRTGAITRGTGRTFPVRGPWDCLLLCLGVAGQGDERASAGSDWMGQGCASRSLLCHQFSVTRG